MCDDTTAGAKFGPEDPPPTRRRAADPAAAAAAVRPLHPALQASHRFTAPAITGDEVPAYFAGYLTSLSVAPGEPLSVHVATRSTEDCFVDVYRVTGCADALFAPELRHVDRLGPLSPLRYPKLRGGRKLAPGDADAMGCGWPSHTVLDAVPSSWDSGVYVVQFTAAAEPTGCAAQLLGQDAILIVRPQPGSQSSAVICQASVATWNAYHMWDNKNLYMGRTTDGIRYDELRASRVSFHRPGLGLGMPNDTLFSPSPPKASYLFAFIDWLNRREVAADFCTGLDIARGTLALHGYKAVISVGHDEYWPPAQRQKVRGFRVRGGHTVFLGGNLAFWEIKDSPDTNGIECYKNSGGWKCAAATAKPGQAEEPLDPSYPTSDAGEGIVTSELWRRVPEATLPLTGVYFVTTRPGGEETVPAGAAWWWEEFGGPARPAVGFTVAEPDHWVFDGTGLASGDTFGAAVRLIGHEADGLELDYSVAPPRLSMLDGALPETSLLAYADCRDWGEVDYSAWPPQRETGRQLSCCAFGGSVTMIHRHPEGEGMLFVAPVLDWSLALVPSLDWTQNRELYPAIRLPDATVDAITWNVLSFCMD
jgi:hypothetical protein